MLSIENSGCRNAIKSNIQCIQLIVEPVKIEKLNIQQTIAKRFASFALVSAFLAILFSNAETAERFARRARVLHDTWSSRLRGSKIVNHQDSTAQNFTK